MPKTQKIKLLYVMKLLLERTDEEHGLTLADMTASLAAYGLEVERKTLYDDLDILRQFGLDIEKRHEKREVRYHVVSRTFELPELKLLVDAVQSSKFITHKKSMELIRKLETLTSQFQAQSLGRQVFVANRVKTMNESIYYTVDSLQEAISGNRKIAFDYFHWNEKKEKVLSHDGKRHIVSPFALTWDDENYYMIGYDAESRILKHYRVDKMLHLAVLKEMRDGEDLFRDLDMALYAQKTFGMYGGQEEIVTLRCQNHLAGVLLDRFGTDIVLRKADEAHFDVSVKVAVSPPFLAWLMTFGDELRILEPTAVREAFTALAHKALAPYESL